MNASFFHQMSSGRLEKCVKTIGYMQIVSNTHTQIDTPHVLELDSNCVCVCWGGVGVKMFKHILP